MRNIPKLKRGNVVALVLLSAVGLGLWQAVPAAQVEAAPAVGQNLAPVSSPASFADVIEAVKPAVVNISTSAPIAARFPEQGRGLPYGESPFPGGPSFDELFRHFFNRQSVPSGGTEAEVHSMGSGFIVDPDGLVVTNNHVIDGATEIVVTLNDGTRHPAKLLGNDAKTDLALLKIDTDKPLPHAMFGDSGSIRAGDWVIAIGNPFGLGGTATTGIVSARGRDIQSGPYDDFLQIDAPINQGNSGGPLFDTAGMVIGVNTAIYSPNGGNVGIGFAIPASQASQVIDQLRTDGHVQRGWLGVQIQRMDDELAAGLGLESSSGALVAEVVAKSPAEAAGLRPGDVIVGFDGTKVEDIKDLTRGVAAVQPDSQATLEVWRDGKTKTLNVRLGESPDDAAMSSDSPGHAGRSGAGLGLSLLPLTPENRRQFGVADDVDGALVAEVEPGSEAARKGLRPGDVIMRVGSEAVTGPAQVVKEIDQLRKEERPSVVFQIARGDGQRFLALPLA